LSDPAVRVFDNLLAQPDHAAIWSFLNQPGWAYGGFSADEPDADRYFYKHFAGYRTDGREARDAAAVEAELAQTAPMLAKMWTALKAGPLAGEGLSRCYANAMAGGVEGGLHLDSNIESHRTAIYYPHPAWHPNFGGETLLFNAAGDEIVAAIYPKPNRLAIFAGTIPHVARPMSRRRPELRITLMFKTMPA
jgi:SM-20-related protein